MKRTSRGSRKATCSESTFGEFAAETPQLFEAVIAERDRYMAARLRECTRPGVQREVLAVVGAGHLKGLARGTGRRPAAIRRK